MTFKITAWNSDGTDIVEIYGPVAPLQLHNEPEELTCPHCLGVATVGHLEWSALVCPKCGRDVEKPDWLVPLGS